MPLSDKKVITIILDECEKLPERTTGYRRAIRDTITDILMYERRHLVEATNIQQRVNQKCDSAAELLVGGSSDDTARSSHQS